MEITITLVGALKVLGIVVGVLGCMAIGALAMLLYIGSGIRW